MTINEYQKNALRTARGYPLCLLGGGVGLLLIRSWVLGNEAHEN